MSGNIQLSEHFWLAEMIQSQTASRRGINNYPDAKSIANLKLLCAHILEPIRSHYGVPFSPNSGYRCPALNAAVNGAHNSQHQYGQAADIVVPGVTQPALRDWIRANLDFDQLILEFYRGDGTGWVHCSYKSSGNRKQAIKIG